MAPSLSCDNIGLYTNFADRHWCFPESRVPTKKIAMELMSPFCERATDNIALFDSKSDHKTDEKWK